MLSDNRGIVFRTVKYGDTSLIVDIYTENKGLRSYIISGVRRKKAKTKASVLQVMNMVDFTAYDRDEKSLNRIREIKIHRIYQRIPFDIVRTSIGVFIIEVCRKSIREAESNAVLFDFLYRWFVHLDSTTESCANTHLLFLLDLSAMLGFGPSDTWQQEGDIFDLQEGTFTAHTPAHGHFLDAVLSYQVHLLFHHGMSDIHTLPLSSAQRRSLLDALLTFYALHVAHFGELRSLTVLRDVMT